MKYLFTLVLLAFSVLACSQKKYNLKKNVVVHGYDVVSYFSNKAQKGIKKFSTTYDGVIFHFINENNLKIFKRNPEKYVPQYGGYCAYAIGLEGEIVGVNPKTFEIRDNKLYLFYNSWGINTLKLWLKENPEELRKKADKNWAELMK